MGILSSGIEFTGAVGTYTFYRKQGSDKIFVRQRHNGGRKKKKKELSPRVQETVSEFSLCASTSKAIRWAIRDIKHLADYNFTPKLTGLCRKPQKLDPVGKRGERSVLVSQHPSYFAGFNLNKNHLFDSIIRHPLQYSIDPVAGTAKVELPELQQGVSLFLPWPVPQFRVIMALGLVADQMYDASGKKDSFSPSTAMATTGWLLSTQQYKGQTFELSLPLPAKRPKDRGISYVLSIGIEMEITVLRGSGGIRKAGAGKIVDLVRVEG